MSQFRRFLFLLGFTLLLTVSTCGFSAVRGSDRAPALPAAAGRQEAKSLIDEILNLRLDENVTNTGALKIRDENDQLRTIPIRLSSFNTSSSSWVSLYETRAAADQPEWKLEVLHSAGKPHQYFISSVGKSGPSARKELKGSALMASFAGSDFWIADLGMEFFSWPDQRILKSDMRHSRACKVLESINPSPSANAYSRVVSWVTTEAPHGPVHADAYDASGKKMKEFDPKSIERLHGNYQLRSVEMRNLRTGSSTILEFDNPQ